MSFEFSAGYFRGKYEGAMRSIEKWRVHCAGLEQTIENLQHRIASLEASELRLSKAGKKLLAKHKRKCERDESYLHAHMKANRAVREHLLSLLDDVHGGEENNPARQASAEGFVCIKGPDEGKRLDNMHSVWLRALRKAVSEEPILEDDEDCKKITKYDIFAEPDTDPKG